MDVISHGLVGRLCHGIDRPKTRKMRWALVAAAMLPDLPVAFVYVLLGRDQGRPFWIAHNEDWIGVREMHPVWSAMWEIPHSFWFLAVVAAFVWWRKLPWVFVVSYASHLVLDLFTHTGEWAVKPFYPLSYRFEGVTDAWAWPLEYMALSWIILGAAIVVPEYLAPWWQAHRELPRSAQPEEGSSSDLVPEPGSADISAPNRTESVKLGIDYLSKWNESYQKILAYVGAAAGAIVTLTIGFIVKEQRFLATIDALPAYSSSLLKSSLACMGVSLVAVVLGRVFTYNWWTIGIMHGVRNARLDLGPPLDSEFNSYVVGGYDMKHWGRLSLRAGLVAGGSLLLGVGLYIVFAWTVVEQILGDR